MNNNTDLRSLLGAELNILLALFQLKSPAPISNFGTLILETREREAQINFGNCLHVPR